MKLFTRRSRRLGGVELSKAGAGRSTLPQQRNTRLPGLTSLEWFKQGSTLTSRRLVLVRRRGLPRLGHSCCLTCKAADPAPMDGGGLARARRTFEIARIRHFVGCPGHALYRGLGARWRNGATFTIHALDRKPPPPPSSVVLGGSLSWSGQTFEFSSAVAELQHHHRVSLHGRMERSR